MPALPVLIIRGLLNAYTSIVEEGMLTPNRLNIYTWR